MKHSLILLFGMPRSGTTWIGKIFDSHPNTLYRHEPDSVGGLKPVPLIAPIDEAEKYRSVISYFVARMPRMNTSRVAGSLPLFPKRYQSSAHLLLKRFAVLATKASESFARELPIVDLVDYDNVADLHLVWKSIESVGRLGVVLHAVSESRAVLILRHPCGYVASVLAGEGNHRFDSKTASSEDYPVYDMLLRRSSHKKRNPNIDDLKTLQPVERLAWRWVLFNEIALEDSEDRGNCMFVRYEDLCAQPLVKAKELLRFAGLTWHPQVESFVQRSTSHNSTHYYSVFKNPEESSTKWENLLSQRQISQIYHVLGESRLSELYPNSSRYVISA